MAPVGEGCWFTVVGAPATSRIAEASPVGPGRPRLCACWCGTEPVPSQALEAPRRDAPYGARCSLEF